MLWDGSTDPLGVESPKRKKKATLKKKKKLGCRQESRDQKSRFKNETLKKKKRETLDQCFKKILNLNR